MRIAFAFALAFALIMPGCATSFNGIRPTAEPRTWSLIGISIVALGIAAKHDKRKSEAVYKTGGPYPPCRTATENC